MKYIVNSKEVSRNTFYFCKKAKSDNKSFVLLKYNNPDEIENFINDNLEYDYYVCDNINSYYTKGEAIVTEWYERDRSWFRATVEDMTKRYKKSKFKDTMTFTDWYTRNGWEYKTKLSIAKESHDIPTVEEFEEVGRSKLFSVKANNDDTVKAINEIKKKNGDCIEYVLRTGAYTEIIYRDRYKEI